MYIIIYSDTKEKYPYKGKIICIDSKESNNIIGKAINTILRVYRIRKIKKKYNIDKSISFTENANIINILSRYKEKVIISIRNNKSRELQATKQEYSKNLIKKVYNRADKIIAISEGVKQDLIEHFNVDKFKTDVIYNPVDAEYIDKLKEECIEDEYKHIFNGKVIITSGRLTYQKGQWYLIRAFSEVKKKIKDCKLIILGAGELEEKLKLLVKNLNLQDSVYFLGFQTNPFKYINNSDIFVLTSLFEGFGNVITEAMECGTMVISTDCEYGPKEILNPSNMIKDVKEIVYGDYGILIPNFDGEVYDELVDLTKQEILLVQAIVESLNNDSLKSNYKNKLKQRVDDFNVSRIVSKWCEL